MGKTKNRQFIVNVQFASQDEDTGERLRPEEFDFMIAKLLRMVLAHIFGSGRTRRCIDVCWIRSLLQIPMTKRLSDMLYPIYF